MSPIAAVYSILSVAALICAAEWKLARLWPDAWQAVSAAVLRDGSNSAFFGLFLRVSPPFFLFFLVMLPFFVACCLHFCCVYLVVFFCFNLFSS